jgi:hypothetical protein
MGAIHGSFLKKTVGLKQDDGMANPAPKNKPILNNSLYFLFGFN